MAKKVDRNQSQIVADLRKAGLHVTHMHMAGKGAPDVVVTGYHHGIGHVLALLVEIKADKGKLTPDEVAWHASYPDDGPLLIAYTTEDILRWFGLIGHPSGVLG